MLTVSYGANHELMLVERFFLTSLYLLKTIALYDGTTTFVRSGLSGSVLDVMFAHLCRGHVYIGASNPTRAEEIMFPIVLFSQDSDTTLSIFLK